MTTIYTVSHGSHTFEYFRELLLEYEIAFVFEVRSGVRVDMSVPAPSIAH